MADRTGGGAVPELAIIEAPSVLGLFPGGVERLPEALLTAGLAVRLGARHAGRLAPPPYRPERDAADAVRNTAGLRRFAVDLADAVGAELDAGAFPVVLGGDCSIVLGPLLALRRRGRYGLLFLDGHADFYQPAAEPNGEAASMDLALATGHGPAALANLEGRAPLVRGADVVHLGRRDHEEAEVAGSQRIEDSDITVIDLPELRRLGPEPAMHAALEVVAREELDGFWIHLDADVVDDALLPAVDYRLPGGLGWDELEVLLRQAIASGRAVGFEVTILNPTLDPDGTMVAQLVERLVGALATARG